MHQVIYEIFLIFSVCAPQEEIINKLKGGFLAFNYVDRLLD
jgi:hypothetical protein